MGVEFRNPRRAPGGWLPLDAFDNKELDPKAPREWLTIRKPKINNLVLSTAEQAPKEKARAVGALGLWADKDGLCFWRRLQVQKYLPSSERYEGYWENTQEKCRLHRISIVFDDEDPREFAKRFEEACQRRVMADSLLKYNFNIENMPTHHVPELCGHKVDRILGLTQTTDALRGGSASDTTALLTEVNFEFAKANNKMIFDKHMRATGPNTIAGPLVLPPEREKGEAPYLAMVEVPAHNFPRQFSEFCLSTVLNKHASIRALQQIRKECNDALGKDIYNPNVPRTMSVQEFKLMQQSATT